MTTMTTDRLFQKTILGEEKSAECLVPRWIERPSQAHKAAGSSDSTAVWITRSSRLANQIVRDASWPGRRIGYLLLIGGARPEILPALMRRFERVAFSFNGTGFLPKRELDAVLKAPDRKDRLVGGMPDKRTRTVVLWRGDLASLVVPFYAFAPTANGIRPNWDRFTAADYGHTLRIGGYEAASDSVLYEYDPDFRRRLNRTRVATEQTLGASIRRLRKQRQLTRQDFPELDAKTLARIERGEVETPHAETLAVIAARLGVTPAELGSF
jgi:hypothetical protein